MLAVSNKDYHLPLAKGDGLARRWLLVRRNSDSEESSLVKRFTFTIPIKIADECIWDWEPTFKTDRLTFIYDGKSVKAAPRTLRVFKAEFVSQMTDALSKLGNVSYEQNVYDLIVKSLSKDSWLCEIG